MLAIVAESKIFLANPEMNREVYREAFHLNDTNRTGPAPPGQMLIRKAQTSKKLHSNVDWVSHSMATNNVRDNLKKQDYFIASVLRMGFAIWHKITHSSRARWADQPLQRTTKERCSEPPEMDYQLSVYCLFHRPRSARFRAHGANLAGHHTDPRESRNIRPLLSCRLPRRLWEAATGDKDFWIVDVVGNFCFVHPAKQGSAPTS